MGEKNIYDFVKEQIDARDVVTDILGEPQQISGENKKWTSPFRDGDNDPSLVANEKQIKDFGGDFYGDIFNFISAIKGISNQEALEYIIETYNIDTHEFEKPTKLPAVKMHKEKSVKKDYILVPSEKNVEEIYTMFDNVPFSEKPIGEEIGKIKNRITTQLQPMTYSLSKIEDEIIQGKTCIPSAIKAQSDWQDDVNFMQIFMVDVDNSITVKKKKEEILSTDSRHVTVEKILDYCNSIDLQPTFIYTTFSHSEQQHRFRLVYILDVGIQNQKIIKSIYEFLKNTFKDYNIDTAPTSIATLFLGGKEIVYESNKFYTISEIVTPTEIEIIDNSEIRICAEYLQNSRYAITNGNLVFKKNDNIYPISNFVVYITEKRNYINGRDEETKYTANCLILDNIDVTLPPQNITVEQYAKFNFILGSSWDKYAIICAGASNSEKLRETTQIISKNTMVEKNIYAHTGFVRINDKLVYLYHGGAIGDVENIEVDLSKEKLESFCFTDKTFDTAECLKRSLSILEVADYKITIPCLAFVYLAPLFSLLRKQNIHADCVIILNGKTGSRKSSLAAVLLSHFGQFDRDNFPSSFRDTLNSIEKKAYILKDTLNVIDDYNPENNAKIKLDILEKIFSMYGDRVGRTRMSQDGTTLKTPYTARGLGIVTAETKPDVAQSRIARSLMIDMNNKSIDLDKLTVLQNNTEQLAYAMMQFILWFINNETEILKKFKEKFLVLQNKQNNNNHGRTNEIINVLNVGFSTFLDFLYENKIITLARKEELEKIAFETLNDLLEEQSKEIEELKPTDMFLNAIEQLIETHQIKVLDYGTQAPFDGYCIGTDVGYYDSSCNSYYFFPDIIYNTVISFYDKQHIKFPLSQSSLWKYLKDENILYSNDPKRTKMKRTVKGKSNTIVAIKTDTKLFSLERKKHRTSMFDRPITF